MEDHVGKRFTGNRDIQILHMGEIRLCPLARRMLLDKNDLVLWPMKRSPFGDVPLERSDLCGPIAARMLLT